MRYATYSFFFALLLIFYVCGTAMAATQSVNTKEMQALVQENKDNPNFVILDVGHAPAYARGHLAGAISLPAADADFAAKLDTFDKSKIYLVYCPGGRWTPQAVTVMEKLQFTHIYASSEGLSGWIQAGNKVVSGNQ